MTYYGNKKEIAALREEILKMKNEKKSFFWPKKAVFLSKVPENDDRKKFYHGCKQRNAGTIKEALFEQILGFVFKKRSEGKSSTKHQNPNGQKRNCGNTR